MKLDISSFDAIIWDMDGVIVDSEILWPIHQPQWLQKKFPLFPHKNFGEFTGVSVKKIFHILQKYHPELVWEKFSDDVEQFALQEIYPHAKIFPGVEKILKKFSKTHTQAIGSSALSSWIEKTITTHNLEKIFQTIVSSQDIEGDAKPAPDIFLQAAKNLGISPKKCLVIEDSPSGILAAKRAGMTVGVFLSQSNKHCDTSGGDFYFEDFSELENMIS